MPEIKYNIIDDFDHVFDEKGNTFLALRKLTWGDNDSVKLDIRKWFNNKDGQETAGKGVSFLTEEGPNELVRVMLKTGYGRTDDVIDSIKDRDDFKSCIVKALGKEVQDLVPELEVDEEDEYYDPKQVLL